jgi:hypothetical protein
MYIPQNRLGNLLFFMMDFKNDIFRYILTILRIKKSISPPTVQFGQNSLVGTAHSPGCLLVRIKLEPPEKVLHVLNHLPLCVYQRSGSIKKSPLSCNVLFHVTTPQGEVILCVR